MLWIKAWKFKLLLEQRLKYNPFVKGNKNDLLKASLVMCVRLYKHAWRVVACQPIALPLTISALTAGLKVRV